MAVEQDNVNNRVIVVAGVLTTIIIVGTVFLVDGWFHRHAEKLEIESSDYSQVTSRELERKQLDSVELDAPRWADKQAGTALLPIEDAMRLAAEAEKARQKR